MTYTRNDKLKAMAIVNIFETSRPFGDYAACVVLNDGAGVSYGISQFTHRSGSLHDVVEAYLDGGGQIGREILAAALPQLKRKMPAAIKKLAADEQFKKGLRAAAVTREMKDAQQQVAFEKYLRPALEICAEKGFVLPLSLAVVYDSITHGSWDRIADRVSASSGEKAWITEYIRKRHIWLTAIARLKSTAYRTRFFLDQIATGNWALNLPLTVHGLKLTEAMFPATEPEPIIADTTDKTISAGSEPGATVAGPTSNTGTSFVPEPTGASSERGISVGAVISHATEKFDHADAVISGFARRSDSVKSVWTTVIGTVWQAAWAVFGFLVGLPKEVWIVVAVIAGALMLLYLYRQIALGKLRELNLSDH